MFNSVLLHFHPEQDRLSDGSEVRRCPLDLTDGKILYCTRDARFFSHRWMLNPNNGRFEWCFKEVKSSYTPNRKSQVSHHKKAYPKMRHHGNRDCHFLMVCAFIRIPDVAHGEVIDHINGDVRNYALANLRIIDRSINYRDGGFLRKLRNQHIDPTWYAVPFLLRYFDRMAAFKASHTRHQYTKLTHDDLLRLLVEPEFRVGE